MLDIVKKGQEKLKDMYEILHYNKISRTINKRLTQVDKSIFEGNGEDSEICVKTRKDYIILFKILQETYGGFVDDFIVETVKHEHAHVKATKEVCKNHNSKLKNCEYGIKFIVTDRENQDFAIIPFNRTAHTCKLTDEEKEYILTAPEEPSIGDIMGVQSISTYDEPDNILNGQAMQSEKQYANLVEEYKKRGYEAPSYEFVKGNMDIWAQKNGFQNFADQFISKKTQPKSEHDQPEV